jgi:hypothetical protein
LAQYAWERLREQGRIYYRVVTKSAPGDEWANDQTSTPDEVAEEAPVIEVTGREPRLPVPTFNVLLEDELKLSN